MSIRKYFKDNANAIFRVDHELTNDALRTLRVNESCVIDDSKITRIDKREYDAIKKVRQDEIARNMIVVSRDANNQIVVTQAA